MNYAQKNALQNHQVDLNRIAGQTIGPSKIKIKAIASNIRYLPNHILNESEIVSSVAAREGDIIVAEVVDDRGSINFVENNQGRDVRLYNGDIFLGVLANRHSSTSEYGSIPDVVQIGSGSILDLLAVGGILGYGEAVPSMRANKNFLKVKAHGVLVFKGETVGLSALFSRRSTEGSKELPSIVFVCGTSAEVGKTTTSTGIVRALKRKGKQVAAAKLTGTGRLRDILAMHDAGADYCADFPNAGLASTYTEEDRAYEAAICVLQDAAENGCEVVVAELGGDIIEANIPRILSSNEVKQRTIAIVHVSGDVLGILGSIKFYSDIGVNAKLYLTLPKGRNNVGTQDRLKAFGLEAFDPLSESGCDEVATEIVAELCNRSRA